MKTDQLMKWGFMIPTKEYIGGILAGLGLGILLTTSIISPEHHITEPWAWFLVVGCILIGVLLARAGQRRRFQEVVSDGKGDA
jgi:hypothetical protein